MDLCDDPEDPFITAMLEVPGMKPDHLSVRIENGQLIIEGERTGPRLHTRTPETRTATTPSGPSAVAVADAQPAITALYPIRELKYGKFRRNITLPPGVNVSLPDESHQLTTSDCLLFICRPHMSAACSSKAC